MSSILQAQVWAKKDHDGFLSLRDIVTPDMDSGALHVLLMEALDRLERAGEPISFTVEGIKKVSDTSSLQWEGVFDCGDSVMEFFIQYRRKTLRVFTGDGVIHEHEVDDSRSAKTLTYPELVEEIGHFLVFRD